MAKIHKLNKNGKTIYPATIPQAVIDPESGISLHDDLALKANHGYASNPKTLKEVEDNANVKIENVLIGGSFEDDSNGDGIADGGIVIVNPYPHYNIIHSLTNDCIIGSKAQKFVGGVEGGVPTLRLKDVDSLTDKYYYSFWTKSTIAEGLWRISNGSKRFNIPTSQNVYRRDSVILNNSDILTVDMLFYDSLALKRLPEGEEVYIDGLMQINLTKIFGEGNEPTKEEFELFLSTLGIDYFEGEITIPAMQLQQQTLKELKKVEDTFQIDFLELLARLEYIESEIGSRLIPIRFEQNTISSATGIPSDAFNAKRIRTIDFWDRRKYNRIEIGSEYQFFVYFYNKNEEYIDYSGASWSQDYNLRSTLNAGVGHFSTLFKIAVSRVDGGDISPKDNLQIKLTQSNEEIPLEQGSLGLTAGSVLTRTQSSDTYHFTLRPIEFYDYESFENISVSTGFQIRCLLYDVNYNFLSAQENAMSHELIDIENVKYFKFRISRTDGQELPYGTDVGLEMKKKNELDIYKLSVDGDEVKVKSGKNYISFVNESTDIIITESATEITKVEKMYEDDNKKVVYSFDISSEDSSLILGVDVTYKQDTIIEEEGLIGNVSGGFTFKKDGNVVVEGKPVAAGFIDMKKTKFALCSEYGSWKAFRNRTDNVFFPEIEKKSGTNDVVRFKVLKSTPPIRLLCQPGGKNSTYTLVDHTDHSSIDSTKAIFYGASDSQHPDYGVKGLIPRGIKGTFHMFAAYHTSTNIAFIDDDVLNLYLQLQNEGIEIGAHTMRPADDLRSHFEQYLPLFEQHFNSRSYSCHGYLQNPNSAVTSRGHDPESEYYIMDLMENWDYFRSYIHVNEELNNSETWPSKNMFPDWRFGFPYYILYQHTKVNRPVNGKPWLFKDILGAMRSIATEVDAIKRSAIVQEWVDSCGVVIDHSYLRRTTTDYFLNIDGTITLKDSTSHAFELISEKIQSDEIWNPTASEFMDYFIKLQKVTIQQLGSSYKINNESGETLNLSLLIGNNYSGTPSVNNQPLSVKSVSKGTIAWGNFPVGETIINI